MKQKKKIFIILNILVILFSTISTYSFAIENVNTTNITENATSTSGSSSSEHSNSTTDSNKANSSNSVSNSASLDLASQAAIICDASSGKIIYEKNANEIHYPASTTKIMTALLTIENCDLDEIATVSEHAVNIIKSGYVTASLQPGEQISVKDLLYALLLKSANEAANVLAEHVAGSIEDFADMMNQRASELGCENTHFVNPNGVHDENHYSTAYDMFLIAQECMKNETFRKYVSTTSYTLPATEKWPTADRYCKNTNDMIQPNSKYYYEGAIGIKTGFTTEAKNCLISAVNKNGFECIAVVLGAGTNSAGLSERYLDTKALFDYAYENYSVQTLVTKNTVIDTIKIKNGTRDSRNLNLQLADDISATCENGFEINDISPKIELDDNLTAPIIMGTKVGSVSYEIDGTTYTQDLVAGSTVYEKTNISMYLIIAGLIMLLFAIILMPKKRHSRKHHKKYTKKLR
jgi:D-alanyl-D-alanine carboxypeptidase (penicillin-binding protein 5/6)